MVIKRNFLRNRESRSRDRKRKRRRLPDRPVESPKIPSKEESDDRHHVRRLSKRASSRSISKNDYISKAFIRGLLRRCSSDMSRRPEEFATDYIRAPSFTDKINGEMVPLTFKLPILQAYDRRDDPEDHLYTFISAFRLYCVPDSIICRAFSVFLQESVQKWF